MNAKERRTNDRRNDMRRGESRRMGARREADANDDFLLPDIDKAFPDVPDFPVSTKAAQSQHARTIFLVVGAVVIFALGFAAGRFL